MILKTKKPPKNSKRLKIRKAFFNFFFGVHFLVESCYDVQQTGSNRHSRSKRPLILSIKHLILIYLFSICVHTDASTSLSSTAQSPVVPHDNPTKSSQSGVTHVNHRWFDHFVRRWLGFWPDHAVGWTGTRSRQSHQTRLEPHQNHAKVTTTKSLVFYLNRQKENARCRFYPPKTPRARQQTGQ